MDKKHLGGGQIAYQSTPTLIYLYKKLCFILTDLHRQVITTNDENSSLPLSTPYFQLPILKPYPQAQFGHTEGIKLFLSLLPMPRAEPTKYEGLIVPRQMLASL